MYPILALLPCLWPSRRSWNIAPLHPSLLSSQSFLPSKARDRHRYCGYRRIYRRRPIPVGAAETTAIGWLRLGNEDCGLGRCLLLPHRMSSDPFATPTQAWTVHPTRFSHLPPQVVSATDHCHLHDGMGTLYSHRLPHDVCTSNRCLYPCIFLPNDCHIQRWQLLWTLGSRSVCRQARTL